MSGLELAGGWGTVVLGDLIGSGGQAEVYLATARGLPGVTDGASVAVKLYRTTTAADAAGQWEESLLGRLGGRVRQVGEEHHRERPWIVPMHGSGRTADGRRFLVLTYYPWSLHRWVQDRNPPTERLIEALMLAVSAAIEFERSGDDLVFDRVHGDYKPENFLVREVGGDLELVIADLGGARDARTLTRTPAGATYTPGFGAPEQQIPGPVRDSMDIYALAATIYAVLTDVERPADGLAARFDRYTREGARLRTLFGLGRRRDAEEEQEFRRLTKLPMSELLAIEPGPALTERDVDRLERALQAQLAGRVRDPEFLAERVVGMLVPELERALDLDPERRPKLRRLYAVLKGVLELVTQALAKGTGRSRAAASSGESSRAVPGAVPATIGISDVSLHVPGEAVGEPTAVIPAVPDSPGPPAPARPVRPAPLSPVPTPRRAEEDEWSPPERGPGVWIGAGVGAAVLVCAGVVCLGGQVLDTASTAATAPAIAPETVATEAPAEPAPAAPEAPSPEAPAAEPTPAAAPSEVGPALDTAAPTAPPLDPTLSPTAGPPPGPPVASTPDPTPGPSVETKPKIEPRPAPAPLALRVKLAGHKDSQRVSVSPGTPRRVELTLDDGAGVTLTVQVRANPNGTWTWSARDPDGRSATSAPRPSSEVPLLRYDPRSGPTW